MDEYENYNDCYCFNCDRSFSHDSLVIKPIGQWLLRYGCPCCGHVDQQVFRSDEFYTLGIYLLSIADEDGEWPGCNVILPKYGA